MNCNFVQVKKNSIKIIRDFIKADSGKVNYSTKFGSDHSGFIKNLGYLPERPYFHANLTGQEFVEYMAKLHDMKRAEYLNQIKRWSERLGIAHALNRKLQNYSKGMLQRVGLAQAMINDPEFLFLDEPTLGLDPQTRNHIWDYIMNLNKEKGLTVFFTTHYMEEAEYLADHIEIIHKGKIIAEGSLEELIKIIF